MEDFEGATQFPPIAENTIELHITIPSPKCMNVKGLLS